MLDMIIVLVLTAFVIRGIFGVAGRRSEVEYVTVIPEPTEGASGGFSRMFLTIVAVMIVVFFLAGGQ